MINSFRGETIPMKKHIAAILCAGLLFGLAAASGIAAKDVIPKDIRKAMEAGLAERRPARTDIPFTFGEPIIMPGPQQAVYAYLVMNIKNGDLGYAPLQGAPKLQAEGHVYVRLYLIENGRAGKIVNENDMPAAFEVDSEGYDPEASDWYAFGYPLLAGDYLAAAALVSADGARVGIQYSLFSIPDPAGFTDRLDTSTVLVMKGFDRVESPEPPPVIHRGLLAWSVARITPSLEKTVQAGKPLDFFFYIFGVRPDDAGKCNLQVDFQVDKLTRESDINGAKTPLFLKDWTWKRTPEGGSIEAKGEVKNMTGEALSGIEAVVNFFDRENKYVSHAGCRIEPEPLSPAGTSSFRLVQKDDPLIENATVDFKSAGGEVIAKASLIETALRFDTQTFQSPLISLPLPLKQTFEVRTGDKVEYKKEDLAPGRYVLIIRLLDKISGLKGEKKIDFAVE